MIAKLKQYLETHQKQYELLRYLFAGGVTTLLSMLVSYGMCFLLAQRPPLSGNVIRWIIDCINLATPMQVSIANTLSWIVAVLFAFWINRVMVFMLKGGSAGQIAKELLQFTGGRLASFLLFEQAVMLLLKAIGVSNFVNRIIVLIFVMVFNYVISKFWIFKQK